jgi:hypothetical protein
MKRNLTGYQFGIYWTRLNVSEALSSSNGNVCITLSIQNIDYQTWENQMVNVFCVKIRVPYAFVYIIFEKNIVRVEEN